MFRFTSWKNYVLFYLKICKSNTFGDFSPKHTPNPSFSSISSFYIQNLCTFLRTSIPLAWKQVQVWFKRSHSNLNLLQKFRTWLPIESIGVQQVLSTFNIFHVFKIEKHLMENTPSKKSFFEKHLWGQRIWIMFQADKEFEKKQKSVGSTNQSTIKHPRRDSAITTYRRP